MHRLAVRGWRGLDPAPSRHMGSIRTGGGVNPASHGFTPGGSVPIPHQAVKWVRIVKSLFFAYLPVIINYIYHIPAKMSSKKYPPPDAGILAP